MENGQCRREKSGLMAQRAGGSDRSKDDRLLAVPRERRQSLQVQTAAYGNYLVIASIFLVRQVARSLYQRANERRRCHQFEEKGMNLPSCPRGRGMKDSAHNTPRFNTDRVAGICSFYFRKTLQFGIKYIHLLYQASESSLCSFPNFFIHALRLYWLKA